MPKSMTAPARLDLLLDWLNGELDTYANSPTSDPSDFLTRTDFAEIRRAVAAFVQSFDGSAGAGHLEVVKDPTPEFIRGKVEEPTEDALDELGTKLQLLLAQGFGAPGLEGMGFPAESVRFGVRNASRVKPAVPGSIAAARQQGGSKGIAKAMRHYLGAGAYVLQVQGPTVELVPFLVAHLLTQAEMVAVHQCLRPGCGKFLIASKAKGRPRQFCSTHCRDVNRADVKEQERLKKQRRTS